MVFVSSAKRHIGLLYVSVSTYLSVCVSVMCGKKVAESTCRGFLLHVDTNKQR